MANLVYVNEEAAITWRSSGGTNLMTNTSVASGAGRQGAQHDFGVAARARTYSWRAFVQFVATPTVGDVVRVYIKTSDLTNPDNDDGTGDIAVSAEDKLRNLQYIGSIVVDQGAADIVTVASGTIDINARAVMPVFWNATAVALTATALEHGFDLVPVPDEIQ